ncbi:MAG: MauE/DoxX family redox-associated membrane protein, partial [Flavobacteriaceae bacterium]
LIFGFLWSVNGLNALVYDFGVRDFMLDFMASFYLVFSFFKFLDLRGFVNAFRGYDPLANRLALYGYIYPFIELTLGLMFLTSFAIDLAVYTTLFILGLTTVGVIDQLRQKNKIVCACLGSVLNLPMTEATLIENLIMIAMAMILIFGS